MLKTVDFIIYHLYFTIYNKLFVLEKCVFFNFVFNNLRFFVESRVETGFTDRNIFTFCNFIRRLYTVFFGRILRFPQPFGSRRQPYGKMKSRKTAISFCTFLPEEPLYQSFQHFQHMLCWKLFPNDWVSTGTDFVVYFLYFSSWSIRFVSWFSCFFRKIASELYKKFSTPSWKLSWKLLI